MSPLVTRLSRCTVRAQFLLTFLFIYCVAFAQIPKNPNQTSKKGKRQGAWTIQYDGDRLVTTDVEQVQFYRIITYEDDKPVGKVRDYYKSGQLQMEATILADRPEQIIDGLATWYHFDGKKEVERDYKNGELLTEQYFKKDGTPADLWEVMNAKGVDIRKTGKAQEAIPVLEEAKYQAEIEQGTKSPEYTVSCTNLASTYEDLGNFAKAEPLYLEAKELYETQLGTDWPSYSALCNNLGNLYSYTGNFAKAETFLVLSAKLFLASKDSLNYAQARKNLATTYKNQNKFSEAEPLFIEARQMIKQIAPHSVTYASACEGLANLYIEWTDRIYGFRNARDLYDEALAVYKETVGPEHPDYAHCLVAYSRFFQNADPAKAEEMLLEARDLRAAALGKEHPEYQLTNYNLAHFYRSRDDFDKAKPFYEEMKDFQLGQLRKNFVALSEKEQQLYFQSVKFFFDDYVSFCLLNLRDSTSLDNIYNLQLVTKGFLYQSTQKTRLKIMGSGDSTLIRAFETLKSKRDHLAKLYQLSEDELKKQGSTLTVLEAEANTLEKEINRRAAAYGIKELDEKKLVTWKDVRNKLKAGEAAIEIIRAQEYRWGNATEPVYLAMIVTRETKQKPFLIIWKDGEDIETRGLKLYRNSIQNQLEDKESYDRYWGDVFTDNLKGINKIYFSPDGVFHKISLSTLRNPVTGKYLGDGLEIRVIGSTRDIVQPLKISKSTKTLLFGFPDYKDGNEKTTIGIASAKSQAPAVLELTESKESRFFDRSTGAVTELPGTQVEVSSIHQLMLDHHIPVDMFTQKKASEKNIKEIKDPKILHIATHGFFLPDVQIELGNDGKPTARQNPLLRSGLLLAGCEPSLQGLSTVMGEEDGILTAYEAMNLFLDDTDLVVLSACETGLGEIQNGEGVYGLQRAFQQAGAKSILISLWKVSDSATQLLMTTLYSEYVKTNDLRQSFVTAQNKVRAQYPEPYYWGAFVLIGG